MCGIAGIFTLERPTTSEDVAAVRRMMDAQIHRGPDGAGLYQAPHAVLGHRRLSIIDLSDAGRQPMSNEDKTVWVTYNGEVYNFAQLREELSRGGHSFKSRTDTEVLVHGYEEWGIEGLLGRLRGMFAFALYDARSSQSPCLFLAKDRFGIKPLYYAHNRREILFASEVRAILHTGLVPNELNKEALIRFLQLGSVPIPMTTVKEIQALPTAHYAVIDEKGFRLKQYWDLWSLLSDHCPSSGIRTFDDVVEQTRVLLNESVKLHLISDVPLGVFLSGGVDSSALVAIASGLRGKPLTTVSIVFDEEAYSEAPYARIVADRYHTDHREIVIRQKDFVDSLPAIFAAMDQPTVDGVNTFLVSKAAKELRLTVVLSGLGGDEVFLGYRHLRQGYALGRSWQCFYRLPPAVRRMTITVLRQAGSLTRKPGLEKLAYLEQPSCENVYLMYRGLFSPRQVQALSGVGETEFDGLLSRFHKGNECERARLGDSLCFLEFEQYLQNQLLKDTDFMSMAHSIEARVPYLDHQLVEYVLGCSPKFKLERRVNKPLLVNAVGNGFPSQVWARRKMGFTFPFAKWLKESSDSLQSIAIQQTILDKKAVEDVWRGFHEGRLHWSRPWATVLVGQFSMKP